MERLLCIKIASRGDLLLAGPSFRLLRTEHPAAHITLMVGQSCEDVARHLPFFNEILAIDDRALLAGSLPKKLGETAKIWRCLTAKKSRATQAPATGPSLSGEPYTEALIFHRDWRYGFITWLAGIPVRRGLVRAGDPRALTHSYEPPDDEHHIEQYLKLVSGQVTTIPALTGDISLDGIWHFAGGEKAAALAVAATHGFVPGNKPWIAMGFGGGRNVKTQTNLKAWPLTHYRELASQVVGLGFQVVWVGDAEDARRLDQAVVGVNLAGKLTVPETAAVLSICKRVVSNDSLTLHLAEALGVPTIALFGPTDPRHYRPLGRRSIHLRNQDNLPCSPCHRDGRFPVCAYDHRCMKSLTVGAVLEKIRATL